MVHRVFIPSTKISTHIIRFIPRIKISYNKMMQAYKNIFQRCGLPAVMVEADSGAIGGKESREFMLIAESGEDEIFYCPDCKYAANGEKAESVKERAAALLSK